MAAQWIDGRALAAQIKEQLQVQIKAWATAGWRPPCLAVVLVGDDPASQIYVQHKEKACAAIGMGSFKVTLPAQTSQSELLSTLQRLSRDDKFDGILLQLPLPSHLNSDAALDAIAVDKDVDGLTPLNQGRLVTRRSGLFSCTPLGCMALIQATGCAISGKRAVVIGRSLLVGAPLATMLSHANATVTIIHSRTLHPQNMAAQADILVVAAGQPELVDDQWIKPGAVVIDVGMHRLEGRLVGDVNQEAAAKVAGYLTPVPGGVGPMTIAMLLKNCVQAYRERQVSLPIDTQTYQG